jgi:hypothetical protein
MLAEAAVARAPLEGTVEFMFPLRRPAQTLRAAVMAARLVGQLTRKADGVFSVAGEAEAVVRGHTLEVWEVERTVCA